MAIELITTIQDALFQGIGGSNYVGLFIVIFFIIAFLLVGLDFRLSLLINSILIVGLGIIGWIPSWIIGLTWVVIIGFGLWMFWNLIRRND